MSHPKSLAHLNKALRSMNVVARRSPAGYYYFNGFPGTSTEYLVSSGVYVFNCRDLSIEDWKREAADAVREHIS
jgi:hypothetical protein